MVQLNRCSRKKTCLKTQAKSPLTHPHNLEVLETSEITFKTFNDFGGGKETGNI